MTINANGTFIYPEVFKPGSKVLGELTGTFGSGVATVGFIGADNTFSPYTQLDGTAVTVTSRCGFECTVPRSRSLAISMTGYASPISFTCVSAD